MPTDDCTIGKFAYVTLNRPEADNIIDQQLAHELESVCCGINQDDNIYGFSAGAGIKYPIGNFDFYFDYAYRQLTDYFDSSNIFTVKIGL